MERKIETKVLPNGWVEVSGLTEEEGEYLLNLAPPLSDEDIADPPEEPERKIETKVLPNGWAEVTGLSEEEGEYLLNLAPQLSDEDIADPPEEYL